MKYSAPIGKMIADGAIIGWFQGRMEFGPRALGNRSFWLIPDVLICGNCLTKR
ncbi:MAG: hypothetical protein IPL01_22510 [Acidobacteria bacterium]|nr:hypothetical protein [Acidobacteriota bacterium]